jgi:hypothetical protein
MPSPMSRRKARSWPSARAAARSRLTGGEGGRRQGEDRSDYGFCPRALGQKREDERAQSPAGQNGCRRDARDARIAQPTRIRTLQLSTLQNTYQPILPPSCLAWPARSVRPHMLKYGLSVAEIREEQPMEYARLGNTGLMVSELCLGCMTIGQEADEETSTEIVGRFLYAGGDFLDTADVYSKGVSEEITGRALRGVRDEEPAPFV